MASSSCAIDVFPSFHGPDVRKGLLSHLKYQFKSKGIMTFNDQEIKRGNTIGPELVRAIRGSRISIVVLSKKYASSSWCLDELVQIMKCKEHEGQIVMTIFFEVYPSDVRKQTGDFGRGFKETCEGNNEEVKLRWTKALTDVAEIAGEHSLNWDSEAEMLQKIATDVSNELNNTPSRDFVGMVGGEAHLTKVKSLLCLESDEVKMIGIWGPAGIGKTTIARALFDELSSSFDHKCFIKDLKESLNSPMGVYGYETKKSLQKKLLWEIFNQGDIKINNLEVIKARLQFQRVLIVLDDVDDVHQLEALAGEPSWFGSGSRIIVTTEDKKILKAHDVRDIYHVDFPSEEEALEILCLSAFKQSYVQDGYEKVAKKVAELCGYLPLALCVVGSSLREDNKDEWELQLSRIEASLDRTVEAVLRVGYDRLEKIYQHLFLHVACVFNNEVVGDVISMLSDSNLDVRNGLKVLADRSLVQVSTFRRIDMHNLLQKLGRQIVQEQSEDPGKRQFLVEAGEICDVLTDGTGSSSVRGISFNTSNIGEVSVSKGAFEGMRNLRFLRIYNNLFGGEGTLQIPEDMDYLPRLRLLDWDHYQRKSLPSKFHPEKLVEIHMPFSNLEKLWGGTEPLPNLKKFDLNRSRRLQEIPNLSKATNLEILVLEGCTSLVELPSSIKNLQKLEILDVQWCSELQVIPTNINLTSLERLDMIGCSKLRSFPDISKNIKTLTLGGTAIEDFPPSVAGLFRLDGLSICSRSLKRLTHVPLCITKLFLSNSDIERIPDCVIGLTRLVYLRVESCRKLESIPGLPSSLNVLDAKDCISLKSVCFSYPVGVLRFINCLKLNEEARRGILRKSNYDCVCLPGKKIPAVFTHKAKGRSITIPLSPGTLSASSRFKACILILPFEDYSYKAISCSITSKGGVTVNELEWYSSIGSKHLLIYHFDLSGQHNRCHGVDVSVSEITLEFNHKNIGDKIIECGVQIMTEEAEGSNNSELDNFETESSCSEVDVDYDETVGEVNQLLRYFLKDGNGDGDNEAEDGDEEEDEDNSLGNFESESSSSEVDYYKTGGNTNHHTNEDGDGEYEIEDSKLSQIESILLDLALDDSIIGTILGLTPRGESNLFTPF